MNEQEILNRRLRWASGIGNLEIAKLLLDRGADVHANDDWALRCASKYEHSEMVELLKSYGARL